MNNRFFTIIFIFVFISSYAQVGIGTLTPNSTLSIDGSITTNVEILFSTNITLDETHHTIVASGGTITLPDPDNIIGREYIIKAGSSSTTVSVTTGDVIDSSGASITLSAFESIKVKAIAAGNWVIIKAISGAKKIDELSDAKVSSNSLYLGLFSGNNATGSQNTGLGEGSLISVSGDYNVGLGSLAGVLLGSGENNILIGHQAGSLSGTGITSGDGNIMIGASVDASAQVVSNELNIGDAVYATNLYGATANVGIGNGNNAPNSTLSVNGSVSMPIRTGALNTTYTLTDKDYTYLVNGTSSNSADITLPTAAGREGRIYIIKNVGTSNDQDILTTGSETIDNAASISLAIGFISRIIIVQSDGRNWWIISGG